MVNSGLLSMMNRKSLKRKEGEKSGESFIPDKRTSEGWIYIDLYILKGR